jgi:hypothetical protein
MNKNTPSKTPVVLVAIFFGFAGGLLASLFIFSLNKFPKDVLEQGHPLISAPFLAFLGIMILVAIFHRPIQSLLSRGQVIIKWGDKEISLSEIEENVDTELNVYDSKLADLDADLQELRRTVEILQKSNNDQTEKSVHVKIAEGVDKSSNTVQKIKEEFEWVDSDKLAVLIYHLGSSKFKWRNQHTLVKKTGLVADSIDDIARAFPEHIIRSRGKSGNIIYRLSDKAKAKYLQVIDRKA